MNQPFRFIHASDFHLERPPRGLTEVPEHLRSAFADAPYRAAERVFDAAVKERVDFVAFAGDLVDPLLAGPRGLAFLGEQFARLDEKEIKVYWAGGRSDKFERWIEAWPLGNNVFRFPLNRVQPITHERGGQPLVQILGTSTGQRRQVRTGDFHADNSRPFSVAVAYGSANQDALARQAVGYWALGGEHCRRMLLSGLITAHYSGSPQGRRPQESGPHGCTLVQVDEALRIRTSFITTDAVRFQNERIAVSDSTTAEQLQQILNERSVELLGDPFGPELLVLWKVVGSGPLAGALRRGKWAGELASRLRAEHGQKRPSLWTVAVEGDSAADTPEVSGEESVLGEFLRTARHYLDHADEPLDLEPYLAERHVAGSVASAVVMDEPAVRRRVLAEAAKLGIELLSPEEHRS
jgi:DNA repair protein SbcD/Mre11